MTHAETLAFLESYLRAVEEGATGEVLARFYTPDAALIEHPNALNPRGVRRDLNAILEAAAKGQTIIARQNNELLNVVIENDRVALTLRWSGVFKVDLSALKAGEAMHAHVAQFYTLRDGRIALQETFDCFEA